MLKIWLPLNKDERNQGLGSATTTNNGAVLTDDATMGYCHSITTNGNGVIINGFMNELKTYTAYTMCVWVNMSSSATGHSTAFLSSGNWNTSNGNLCFGLYNFSNGYNKLLIPNKGGWSTSINLSNKLGLNTWYHVAVTYDGTVTMAYVDGVYVGQSTSGGICASSNTIDLKVGAATYTPSFTLKGKICDVRIYNHVLKDWEIKKIYNNKSYEMEGNLYLESTENVGAGPNKLLTDSAYNNALNKYGYNDASNLRKELIISDGLKCDKITVRSGNTAVYPYVYFSSIQPASAAWKTISFDYYPTQQNRIRFYTNGGNANMKSRVNYKETTYTQNAGSIYLNVTPNKWNHVDFSLQGTVSGTTKFGYCCIGSAKFTGQTSDYWLFRSVQITNKDHPTRYTYDSRSQQIVDVSGKDNVATPINVIQSGSSIYFNGTDSAIQIPLHGIISAGTWSINLWFLKPTGMWSSKGYETLVGGPTGFELEAKSGYTNINKVVLGNWGKGYCDYEFDKWNMITFTRTSSGTKLYLNGVQKATGTAGSMPAGDYFIGAWKTSTQQNFKGYIRRVSVYKKELTQEDITNLYLHNE